eukprot:scaffold67205_cov66-Phaeocystis_antarctica.AAC.3
MLAPCLRQARPLARPADAAAAAAAGRLSIRYGGPALTLSPTLALALALTKALALTLAHTLSLSLTLSRHGVACHPAADIPRR